MRRFVVGVCLAALAVGCHKGNGNGSQGGVPTAPTATPTVTALSLSPGTDLLKIKATQAFTVTATLSDGTSRVVQGTWGSDAPSVVSVKADGQVTAVGAGDVTVFADYQGQRATRRLRVVPDYDGTWSGGYRVSNCDVTGDWRTTSACQDEDYTTIWRLDVSMTQNRSAVTGVVQAILDLPAQASGAVATDGLLQMSGTSTVVLDDDSWVMSVSDWNTRTMNNLDMTGSFKLGLGLSKYQGGYTLTCELVGVTRDSYLAPGLARTPRRLFHPIPPPR